MKPVYVAFVTKRLEQEFEQLACARHEDRQLYVAISDAIGKLKQDPCCGVKVAKRLWPSNYVREYGVTNLWKCNLPNTWRLIYTIAGDEVRIMNVILDWFDHKEYERKFKY